MWRPPVKIVKSLISNRCDGTLLIEVEHILLNALLVHVASVIHPRYSKIALFEFLLHSKFFTAPSAAVLGEKMASAFSEVPFISEVTLLHRGLCRNEGLKYIGAG